MNDWGRLPEAVFHFIQDREWNNSTNLHKRLKGERPFPIVINLKPPSDKQAMADVEHFRAFVSQWRAYPQQEYLIWEDRQYRSFKFQQIPAKLVLSTMQQLLEYLGKPAIARSQRWQELMQPLLDVNAAFYPVMIKHLNTLEALSDSHIRLLVLLLPQLHKNMATNMYLRALPLVGVDSKFVETQMPLIADLLDIMHNGEISEISGLRAWLACLDNPSGWITVRPLCSATQQRLGGHSILQLPTTELRNKELPANNILVVENLQSGLGLPPLEETIAVIGGGANVSWMNADWLQNKNLGYWGDIDTWGMSILSDAKALAGNVVTLMMSEAVFDRFSEFRVNDPTLPPSSPNNLSCNELELFALLREDCSATGRLEQERLPADFILSECEKWLASNGSGNLLNKRKKQPFQ